MPGIKGSDDGSDGTSIYHFNGLDIALPGRVPHTSHLSACVGGLDWKQDYFGINSQAMKKPWVVFTFTLLLLSITAASAQRSAPRVTLPVSPECTDAAQSDGPFAPPEAEFVDNPKPFTMPGRESPPLTFEITARIVNSRPLVVDVIDVNSPIVDKELGRWCGFSTLPAMDAKLKPVLSSLRFGQVVKLTVLLAGADFKDWKFVITDIRPSPLPDDGPGACPSKSGIAVSIRGLVPYVNVYNDGTPFYMDYYFNTFRMEKLSPAEMAQLFKAFADSSFNSLTSSPPPEKVDSHSVTLACSRYQRVPDSGLDARLAPVMKQFELLKARATEHAYYLLMTSGRRKLTILDWPFTQVRLSDIANLRNHPGTQSPALQETVPPDFMAKLPQGKVITGPINPDEDPPDRYVYVRDQGRLYRVIRNACWGATPHCTAFRDMSAALVEQIRPGDLTVRPPSEKVTTIPARETQLFALSPALEWPGYMGVDIADVGKEGRKLTNEEFESQPLYFKLFGGSAGGTGARFVDGDYMYLDVRVCRVDPGAPPSQCVSPVIIKGLYRPVW